MFKNLFKNKEIELAEKVVKDNPDNIIKLNILGKLYVENNFFNDTFMKQDKKYERGAMKVLPPALSSST